MLTGGEYYHDEEGAAAKCDTSAVLGRTATLTIMTQEEGEEAGWAESY